MLTIPTNVHLGDIGRSILRNRVFACTLRRPEMADEKLVKDGHVETLLRLAALLGFDLPSEQEYGFYKMAKTSGVNRGSILKVVNYMARKLKIGGAGMAHLPDGLFVAQDVAITRSATRVEKIKTATLNAEKRLANKQRQLNLVLEVPQPVQESILPTVLTETIEMHPTTDLDRMGDTDLVDRVLRETANIATMGMRSLPQGSTIRVTVQTNDTTASFERRVV